MTSPIETVSPSGLTLYAVIHHPDGRVWRADTEVWEVYNSGNWADYAVPMTEQASSGYYRADFPATVVDVLTTEVVYSQAGGSPALSDAPAAGLGQSQGVSLAAVGNVTAAADNLRANLETMVQGQAVAGTLTTTKMTTNLNETLDDVYQGRIIIWTSGALTRRVAYILNYNGTTKLLTFGAISSAPAAGVSFIIV